MLIHPFSNCPACFSNMVHLAFTTGDQVYDITYFKCDVLIYLYVGWVCHNHLPVQR